MAATKHAPAVEGELELPGEEESARWVPGACVPLADVRFEPTAEDPLAPWHIASDDERVDVTFDPLRRHAVRHQMGVVSIDHLTLGVAERMHARV